MRIATLDLLAYGHFRGTSLDFSKPGIHVVIGRNEAGKSTTLRAITGLLYGINRLTPDAFVHKPGDLRIGGTLEAGGERLRIVRRKGNSNTLLDAHDKPIDESVLRRLFGGVTEESFVHAYGLDHTRLAEGANALLQGKGDLGESLFDASVGGGGEVQRLLAELAREADAIFKPRGTALPLNDALKSFADATKQIRERQTLPDAHKQQEEGVANEIASREEAAAKKKELEAQRNLVARARARAPRERQRAHLLENRVRLGKVPDHVARIDALRQRFVAYERDVEQQRQHRAEAELLGDRLSEAMRRAGIDRQGEIEAFRVDARKEGKVNALLRERATLAKSVESATTEIERADRALERLGGGKRIDAAERDRLASALEQARALGDIEQRVRTEGAKLDRQTTLLLGKATALAAQVGLGAPDLATFAALSLPATASLDGLGAKKTDLARKLARQEERIGELEQERATLEKQTASLAGDFAPPDAAALREARTARDAAWRDVQAKRPGAEVALEGLMRDADGVADRMIREADRVITLARLRNELEQNTAHLRQLKEDRDSIAAATTLLADELRQLFAPAHVTPGDVTEMRAWLERHEQIAAEYTRIVEARAALDGESSKIARAAKSLREATANENEKPLAELIVDAASKLAVIDDARRSASVLAEQTAQRDERVVLRDRDTKHLAEISARLAEMLGPLGLAADAPADEVNRSIESLRDVFALADKRAEAEARARAATTATADFEAELTTCLTAAAPELEGEPRTAARELFDRGRRASELAIELAQVEAALAQLGEAVAIDDVGDLEAAEDALTEQIEELERSIQRSDQSIGGIRMGLEKIRVESKAADAAAEAQQHLARVRDGAERWARIKLAQVILAREIERYREENQGPLLAESSKMFKRLTLGAYEGIKAGFDDKDRPTLRCVRGDTEVATDALSDGTRDQLYLSLRLASLLKRAEVADPMPFVLDDVLIHFDDQRASAALQVLAEISQKIQVLFFTHHARLVDVARAAVPADRLVVHTLRSDASDESPTAHVGGLAAVLR